MSEYIYYIVEFLFIVGTIWWLDRRKDNYIEYLLSKIKSQAKYIIILKNKNNDLVAKNKALQDYVNPSVQQKVKKIFSGKQGNNANGRRNNKRRQYKTSRNSGKRT